MITSLLTDILLYNEEKSRSIMKIVVIGGSGFVGSHFIELSKSRKNTIIAPSHKELDITNKKQVLNFLKKTKPQFVINFAAISNIEEWGKEQENTHGRTWQLNVIGVKNLADSCRKTHTFLMQISTDSIFPGTKEYPGPYAEDAKPATNEKTINWYGLSKLKAEEEVKKLEKNFAIIRISHPFGNPKHQRDLVAKTLKDIEKKHAIFSDQLFTPTFIEDLVQAIWAIQKKQKDGIFHVGCKGLVSRIVFARYLLKLLGKRATLVEGSMEEFLKNSAPRTRLGGFLTEYTEKTLGVTFHTWQEALKKVAKAQDILYKASKNIS